MSPAPRNLPADRSPSVNAPADVLPSHRTRLLRDKPAGSLLVHEIYRSLQGESTHAGLPCVFIRLSVCHLRCVYCDTPHAFHSGNVLPIDAVVARALHHALTGQRSHTGLPRVQIIAPRSITAWVYAATLVCGV